ncbi:hypothetical protein C8Q79DRAFT_998672 [Trametes meyenii]|nr:hypothetical protein C8Q79DRAFT_998672 [Trametes meyenii]
MSATNFNPPDPANVNAHPVISPITVGEGSVSSTVGRVDFPSLMDLQTRTLDRLLSQSATGSQLSLSVKQAELAVRDLTVLVKASNLTRKEQLATALEDFSRDARATGRGLQKLYSAVDNILAFNEYATRKISAAQATTLTISDSSVEEALGRTFHSSLSVLSVEVARVILEITRFTGLLDALDERLAAIHALCEVNNVLTTTAKDALLAELWTVLGGNRAKVFELNQQLMVLENVSHYRSLAAAHVAATTETLATIEADLAELRVKLAAPGIVEDVPVEVHITSIERSARRLKEEKLRIDGSTGGYEYGVEVVARQLNG